MRRRAALPKVDFRADGEETAGLPKGVRIRWFRSLVARPFVEVDAKTTSVPDGAIVWTDEPVDVVAATRPFRNAAAVIPGIPVEEGPRTIAEPEEPTRLLSIREAVDEALEAVPADYRVGAREIVEAELAKAGL